MQPSTCILGVYGCMYEINGANRLVPTFSN